MYVSAYELLSPTVTSENLNSIFFLYCCRGEFEVVKKNTVNIYERVALPSN